jgi:hypothetical protein
MRVTEFSLNLYVAVQTTINHFLDSGNSIDTFFRRLWFAGVHNGLPGNKFYLYIYLPLFSHGREGRGRDTSNYFFKLEFY